MADVALISQLDTYSEAYVNVPSGKTAGDVLAVYVTYDSGSAAAITSSGFTAINSAQVFGDGQWMGAWFKVSDGTETQIFFDSTVGVAVCQLWRNCDPTTPVIGLSAAGCTHSQTTPDTSPFSIPVGPLTTTRAKTVLVNIAGLDCGGGDTVTFTQPSGWTKDKEDFNGYSTLACYSFMQTTAGASGTITSTATSTGNGGQMGILFGLQPIGSSKTNRRALVLNSSGFMAQVTDAQLGTGLKPLVWYSNAIKQRATSEGTPLVWDSSVVQYIRLLDSTTETLLI